MLEKFKNDNCVILAVPRGGVPIGYHIAQAYHFPMDLLLTKKIGHPLNKELAIGAVSLEDEIIDDYPYISKDYINNQILEIKESLKKRYKKFLGNRSPIELLNKTVIIVDDGIATGNTLLAAIKMIRRKSPKKIVIAVPVAPTDSAKKIMSKVDEFICPLITNDFVGVGGYYLDFSQVSDEEVIQLMDEIYSLENKK
ncbi:phosphoribosyltransferase [Flavobacterium aquariorum]|uniref:phosphoribosyltransferase n=1 Tax=Flavobacterium aquariorum TaxID=2217670 RepID=UPI0014024922|nr:phosphoribosyltransferase family protein [Flavobacterium aquariorum]